MNAFHQRQIEHYSKTFATEINGGASIGDTLLVCHAVGVAFLALAGWLGVTPAPVVVPTPVPVVAAAPDYSTPLGLALPGGEALFETSLQSRISTSDTSMTLVANSLRGGGVLSGYNCWTIDEGRSDAEFVCGRISGTSVTSLERGLDPKSGTSTVSALKFAHRVGANLKITDFPLIQRLRNLANGAETYPNRLFYNNGFHPCDASVASTTICDKNTRTTWTTWPSLGS